MEFKNILFEMKDQVAYVTINQPEKRNPVGNDTKRELMAAFDECDFNDEIRAMVLRGADGIFSAGGDIKAMYKRIEEGKLGTKISCRLGANLNQRLLNVRKPTIACVEGAAAGSGMCLALSCDFQIVEETAKLAFSFVNIGYVPDSGATYLVTKAVGTTRATELLMSGRKFTGRQAADMGLFTTAVPKEELEETLDKYITKYANGPTVAYGYIKAMINHAALSQFASGTEHEVEYQGMCERTEDHKAAVRAFLNKERPNFVGK